MKTYLERMFCYVAWADRRTYLALRDSPSALAEALPLLAHLLAAEHVWLARIEQREPRHPVWPTLTLDECEALVTENEAGYRALLEEMEEDQLIAFRDYRTSQGQEFATSVIDMLTQVITHGPYHRGQIAKVIGKSGGVPVSTDFIIFVREVEAKS